MASTTWKGLQTDGAETFKNEIIVGFYVVIVEDSNLVGISYGCVGVGSGLILVGCKEASHICIGGEIKKRGLVVVVLIETIEVHLEDEIVAKKIDTMVKQTDERMREGEQHHLLTMYEVCCISFLVGPKEIWGAIVIKCGLSTEEEFAMAEIWFERITAGRYTSKDKILFICLIPEAYAWEKLKRWS